MREGILDDTIVCPKCGEINNRHFVIYYGDTCHECSYDIRTHINNKIWSENRKKKLKVLLSELYDLTPESDDHKERFCQIEWGLSFSLENVDRRLERIKNFDLIGLY